MLSHLIPSSSFTFLAHPNVLIYVDPVAHTPALCLEFVEIVLEPTFLIQEIGTSVQGLRPQLFPPAVGVTTRRK